MNSVSFKSRDAASPWMVLISVCLHAPDTGYHRGILYHFIPTKPSESVVTPVTVVAEPIGPPLMETVAAGPVEASAEVPVQDALRHLRRPRKSPRRPGKPWTRQAGQCQERACSACEAQETDKAIGARQNRPRSQKNQKRRKRSHRKRKIPRPFWSKG